MWCCRKERKKARVGDRVRGVKCEEREMNDLCGMKEGG